MNVNKRQRNFILILNLDNVPRISTPEGFTYIRPSKRVRMIVIKTERIQIDLLSDFFAAILS